jgi:GNAT superfamily N-acetyltransferase
MRALVISRARVSTPVRAMRPAFSNSLSGYARKRGRFATNSAAGPDCDDDNRVTVTHGDSHSAGDGNTLERPSYGVRPPRRRPGMVLVPSLLRPAEEGDKCNNRAALHEEIATATVPPGIVAYLGGTPVGWTRVMPRASVPAIGANRTLRRILPDDPGAWWITCFVVDRRHRSEGVATALIEALVDHARSHGARTVEGHPVDTDALQAQHVSGSALFTGTMHLFLAAGFREVGRTYASRPVMRRELRS